MEGDDERFREEHESEKCYNCPTYTACEQNHWPECNMLVLRIRRKQNMEPAISWAHWASRYPTAKPPGESVFMEKNFLDIRGKFGSPKP
jgi:hypothetical protein